MDGSPATTALQGTGGLLTETLTQTGLPVTLAGLGAYVSPYSRIGSDRLNSAALLMARMISDLDSEVGACGCGERYKLLGVRFLCRFGYSLSVSSGTTSSQV